MNNLIKDDVRQIAIGHSIVQASRPRNLIGPGSSLQIFANNIVSSGILCYTIRFKIRFKQSVVQRDDIELPESHPSFFTQWSVDNVDHNVNNLNGSGSFLVFMYYFYVG